VAFAVFIIADGATHLAAVWSVWQPSAWLATLLKVATALSSVAVALVLPPLVPKALGLGAASAMLDGAPDAILLVDGTGAIRLVNERAERLFGYTRASSRRRRRWCCRMTFVRCVTCSATCTACAVTAAASSPRSA